MNTGFLFTATHFEDWKVDVSASGFSMRQQEDVAEFEDWYRLLREIEPGRWDAALMKPLHSLWLSSFRFLESGYISSQNQRSLDELSALLVSFKLMIGDAPMDELRLKRVLKQLKLFGQAANATLCWPEIADSAPNPSLIGSRWDVYWESLTINHSKNSLFMAYSPCSTESFRLVVTENGFVTEAGHPGFWTWEQYAGGRVSLNVGGDYPSGWGWFTDEQQQEMRIHFYKSAYPRAYERSRWVRIAH